MFNQNDEERDEDRDEEEDADDSQNNDSEEEEEDSDQEDKDEKSKDGSDSDEEDEQEDDDKPVTKKELRELLAKNQNKNNAQRRVSSKEKRHNNNSPKTEDRLSNLEKAQRRSELLEEKRQFGFENDLSPGQVDVVFRMTNRPTKKFLSTPYVKAALDAIRSEENVRNNTPGSGGSRNFRNGSGKSWSKLDEKEKQDNFAERRRAILEGKK